METSSTKRDTYTIYKKNDLRNNTGTADLQGLHPPCGCYVNRSLLALTHFDFAFLQLHLGPKD